MYLSSRPFIASSNLSRCWRHFPPCPPLQEFLHQPLPHPHMHAFTMTAWLWKVIFPGTFTALHSVHFHDLLSTPLLILLILWRNLSCSYYFSLMMGARLLGMIFNGRCLSVIIAGVLRLGSPCDFLQKCLHYSAGLSCFGNASQVSCLIVCLTVSLWIFPLLTLLREEEWWDWELSYNNVSTSNRFVCFIVSEGLMPIF